MLFDARKAKLLKPGEHIVVVGCSGLRLKASTESKAWLYRYESLVDGNMHQIKIGNWPAMPASTAVVQWQALKDRRDAGVDPAQEKRAKKREVASSVYTVADIVADYIDGHLRINRKADGAKAVAARLHRATEALADMPAASVTRRVAFDLIASLADTPVAAKSVRNELGGAWELALDAGRLSEDAPNWWRQIMPGKLRSRGAMRGDEHKGTAKRVLSESELVKLLQDDFSLLSDVVQDVLTLYLWTATRGGEIVQMHASQITQEPDGWWWTLPKAIQKNAKRDKASDLRVPLVGRALAVVRRRLPPTGYLFPSTSKQGYPAQAGIQSQVNFRQPYCVQRPDVTRTRLSVTHWSPHDLRRTARTMLAGLGCPNDVAESILGHVQPGIQGVYNIHTYDKERRVWLQCLSDKLDTLVAHTAIFNRQDA